MFGVKYIVLNVISKCFRVFYLSIFVYYRRKMNFIMLICIIELFKDKVGIYDINFCVELNELNYLLMIFFFLYVIY